MTPTHSQLGRSVRSGQYHADQGENRSAKSHPSQTSSLTNAELICDNCVNKHMMEDKKMRAKDERARDEEYNKELLAKERAEKLREDEENQRRKEKFRQEAVEHWNESKRFKDQQKAGRQV